MKRFASLFCLLAALCPAILLAQVAHVYVATPGGIAIYNADASGKLTAIHGSPYPTSAGQADKGLAVNGKFLFGIAPGPSSFFTNIASFVMESNGTLVSAGTTNALQHLSKHNGYVVYQFLDKAGQNVYAGVEGSGTRNLPYLSHSIEKGTGELNYTGMIQSDLALPFPLAFTGNDHYAYGAGCSQLKAFNRLSDGALVYNNGGPILTPSYGSYCATGAIESDTTNHVVVALAPSGGSDGRQQLGIFSSDSEGRLTTTSTSQNMPHVAVGQVGSLELSPSGSLLAVGGTLGLQVFHFHGSKPITTFTGLLNKSVGQFVDFHWDTHDHLYALDRVNQKLYVFMVTSTGAVQAPGSPYALNAYSLAVQSLPQ